MKRFVLTLAATLCCLSTQAQSWPTKPVRVIASLPAGSATDIVARALSERLTAQLGQPFIVENRPGASGSIAMNLVAKAEPDGYTLLVHSSSGTVVPSTIPNLPFDVLIGDAVERAAGLYEKSFITAKDQHGPENVTLHS